MQQNGKREPINHYEKFERFKWKWNGKYQLLSEMGDSQLKCIIKFVDDKRGFHYGHTSEFWFSTCNDLLNLRKLDNMLFAKVLLRFTPIKNQ